MLKNVKKLRFVGGKFKEPVNMSLLYDVGYNKDDERKKEKILSRVP
ncbi:hypothetical protein [Ligilactobacillus salivarius]